MRGIFRICQSKRVDQLITFPLDDKSWKMLHKMINIAKKFCKLLSSGTFRVNCSICLDFQARRLRVKYAQTKELNASTQYCHMMDTARCKL